MKLTLDESLLVATVIDAAREGMRVRGELLPVAVILKPTGDEIVGFGWFDEATKVAAFKLVRERARGAYLTVLVSEVWMLNGEEAQLALDGRVPMPHEHPNRVDSVAFAVSTSRGITVGTAPVVVRDGVRTFDEVRWSEHSEGRYVDLMMGQINGEERHG
ncbi:MAG TPA: hypothetical protein VIV56_16850 [Gemmatimonadales bacterium]